MPPVSRFRVPALLPLLFGAILLLAGVVAHEAVTALRQREAAAARTLRDYATIAAFELVTRARERTTLGIREVLDPVTGSPAASPYDPLPPLESLSRQLDSLLPCGEAAGPAPASFRLDLRDGSLIWLGDLSPALQRWLADTLMRDAKAAYRPAQRFGVIGRIPGAADRVLVYGLKRVQSGAYAQSGAPIGAFGFVRCHSAFGSTLVRRVLQETPLLPGPVSGGLPNDSLLAVSFPGQPGGDPPAAVGEELLAHETILGPPGDLRVRVALRPAALPGLALVAPGSASRLPWLLGLLAVAVGLALVGVLQLRREDELTRLRSDFTSSVSHELRTPLAQILLSGETIALERTRTPAEHAAAAGIIVQEARRLLRMVENVLSFARLERGVHPVEPRAIRVAPVLRAILTPWLPSTEGLARVATGFDESVWARADTGAMTQVLHNLLDNAIKYGPPGQTITVVAVREGDQVLVSVEDEGPGVPEPDRLRIWEPFVRGAVPDQRPAGGTGLGLAVVRDLVLAQGGSVRVESGNRGGARFVVMLPSAEPVPPEGPRPSPTPAESLARSR